ncbi:hypothetical protein O0L34_g15146 [Tuta absoluta]|nr:hypothetical protein O0L34_g15146 [Tuta absoluta]
MEATKNVEKVPYEEAFSPLVPFKLSSPTPSEEAFAADSVLGEMRNNEAYCLASPEDLQYIEELNNKAYHPVLAADIIPNKDSQYREELHNEAYHPASLEDSNPMKDSQYREELKNKAYYPVSPEDSNAINDSQYKEELNNESYHPAPPEDSNAIKYSQYIEELNNEAYYPVSPEDSNLINDSQYREELNNGAYHPASPEDSNSIKDSQYREELNNEAYHPAPPEDSNAIKYSQYIEELNNEAYYPVSPEDSNLINDSQYREELNNGAYHPASPEDSNLINDSQYREELNNKAYCLASPEDSNPTKDMQYIEELNNEAYYPASPEDSNPTKDSQYIEELNNKAYHSVLAADIIPNKDSQYREELHNEAYHPASPEDSNPMKDSQYREELNNESYYPVSPANINPIKDSQYREGLNNDAYYPASANDSNPLKVSQYREKLNSETYYPASAKDSNAIGNKRKAQESSDSLMAESSHHQSTKVQRELQSHTKEEELNIMFTVPITDDSFACFSPEINKVYSKLNNEFPVELTLEKGAVDLTDSVVRATLVLTNNQRKVLRRCLTHASQVDPARGVLEAGVDEKNVIYELDKYNRPSIIIPVVDKIDDLGSTVKIRIYYKFKCLNTCFKQHMQINSLRDKETQINFSIEKKIGNESIIYGTCCLMCECIRKPKRSFKAELKNVTKKSTASSSRKQPVKKQFRQVPLPHEVLQEKLLAIPSNEETVRQNYEKCIKYAKSLAEKTLLSSHFDGSSQNLHTIVKHDTPTKDEKLLLISALKLPICAS